MDYVEFSAKTVSDAITEACQKFLDISGIHVRISIQPVRPNACFFQLFLSLVLNKASSMEWISIKDKFPALSVDVDNTLVLLDRYNNFLGHTCRH